METQKRKVKSFSLNTVEDKDVIKKLDSVNNISDYIKELIRNDLRNNSSALNEEQIEEVKKIVMEMLKDKNITIEEIKENFDSEAINALDQFM